MQTTKKTQVIGVKVPIETYLKFEAECCARQTNMNQVLKKAIADFLIPEPKINLSDVIMVQGVIGIIQQLNYDPVLLRAFVEQNTLKK